MKSITKISLCFVLFLILASMSCSRGDVPLPTSPLAETAPVSNETESTSTSIPENIEKHPLEAEYAAVWALKEEGLSVRNQAGISATVEEVIPWDSRQIHLTGNRSLLGSSLWLEIVTKSGTTGWVSAWNLTEYVPSAEFCDDPRARALLDEFGQGLQHSDGSYLRALVSPTHELSIRLNWYGPDVDFPIEEVDTIFGDEREIDWGTMADSGLQVLGSMEKVIQPKLEEVFFSSAEVVCNELKWGSTAGEVLWPPELDNINFYAVYRPAREGGNAFDWRTWAIGIEYIHHQPYIAILIHYSSEL